MTPLAVFDDRRVYRYLLRRDITEQVDLLEPVPVKPGVCLWILCNPSTADEHSDDPTIRRCLGFTRRWGYRKMEVANAFAFRATKPWALRVTDDPVGPKNDVHIAEAAQRAAFVVAGWGTWGGLHGRSSYIMDMLTALRIPVHCLHVTDEGEPGHPLYLPDQSEPRLYTKEQAA